MPPAIGGARVPPSLYFRAAGLNAIGVCLSLSTTTFLALDLGSHPVVWLAPLGLYMGTMALAFTKHNAVVLRWSRRCMGVAVLCVVAVVAQPAWLDLWRHLPLLAAVSVLFMACNASLASAVPTDTAGLYYAAMSGGGAIGSTALALLIGTLLDPSRFGIPNSIAQRTVFDSPVPELWMLALGVAFATGDSRFGRSRLRAILEAVALGGLVCALLSTADIAGLRALPELVAGSALIVALSRSLANRASLGASVAVVLIWSSYNVSADTTIIARSRSMFGQLTVIEADDLIFLRHGTIQHGYQVATCADSAQGCASATGYYHRAGPLGRVVAAKYDRHDELTVAVIGLGVGSISPYCRSTDRLSYFEIDPAVVVTAQSWFGYLGAARRRCRELNITIGDGRLLLAASAAPKYDILIVDAFASDSIPVHLVTTDAVRLYTKRLKLDGVIAFHVSNRYLDLSRVLLSAGRDLGLGSKRIEDRATLGPLRIASTWVLLTPDRAVLSDVVERIRVSPEVSDYTVDEPVSGIPAWTDQLRSILTVIK
jgi:hypothetical protein